MIEEILPAAATAVEAFDEVVSALFPEEEAALGRAVDSRRREFTTARHCARAALAQLGLPATPVRTGPHGEPQWPSGVVGSITHCSGYRASVVARACDVRAIGVDAEPNAMLPDGVRNAIARFEELIWLRDLMTEQPEVCWDRLLFSAKEATYKAWFPLAQRRLGFEDVVVTMSPTGGTFSARLLVPDSPTGVPTAFTGRWLARGGLVFTAIAVAAERPTPVEVRPFSTQ